VKDECGEGSNCCKGETRDTHSLRAKVPTYDAGLRESVSIRKGCRKSEYEVGSDSRDQYSSLRHWRREIVFE